MGGMAGGSLSPQPVSVIAAIANAGICSIGVSLDRAFITSTFFMGAPLPRLTIDETPCAQHCGKELSRRIGFFIVGAAADCAINNAIRRSATQPNRDVSRCRPVS
jgi:hypothetical protein